MFKVHRTVANLFGLALKRLIDLTRLNRMIVQMVDEELRYKTGINVNVYECLFQLGAFGFTVDCPKKNMKKTYCSKLTCTSTYHNTN